MASLNHHEFKLIQLVAGAKQRQRKEICQVLFPFDLLTIVHVLMKQPSSLLKSIKTSFAGQFFAVHLVFLAALMGTQTHTISRF